MTEKKNILWIIDGLGMGGAERLMVPYLHHLDRTRFTPRVCVLQEKNGNPMAAKIEQLGVPVDLLPIPKLRTPSGIPQLRRYMQQHQIDLVHTQLEFANILGTLAARWQHIPVVCTLHTFDDLDQADRSAWHIRLMWAVLRRFSNRIIAVSEEIRQHHLRLARFSPDRTVTLYNGIDLSRFQQQATDVRTGLNIPQDAPLLLTVAVLRQPKGIQYMIEALPSILTAVSNAYYVVVGDGAYADALQQAAMQHGVADRIIFTGVRHDIPDLLAASNIFVLPTLLDALPTVLIEAMAAGKPIVASGVGGVPEIVEDGRNGLLVSPAQPQELAASCIQLLQNPTQAHQMGDAGQQIAADKFDIHKQVARLGDIYMELFT